AARALLGRGSGAAGVVRVGAPRHAAPRLIAVAATLPDRRAQDTGVARATGHRHVSGPGYPEERLVTPARRLECGPGALKERCHVSLVRVERGRVATTLEHLREPRVHVLLHCTRHALHPLNIEKDGRAGREALGVQDAVRDGGIGCAL